MPTTNTAALTDTDLTDDMIVALAREAFAAGDSTMGDICNGALTGNRRDREHVLDAINAARAMDDSEAE